MQTLALPLTPEAGGGARRATLRDLRGDDELAVDGIDTRTAIRLIDRLVDRTESDVPPAVALCASDRDRLLAAIQRGAYGDTISASPACVRCGSRFDLSFSLSALERHLALRRTDDPSLACPLGRDELAAASQPWAEGIALLRAAAGDAAPDRLESVAPLLDLEVEARCPECQHVQPAGFDIQSFLLTSLLNERQTLVQDIHLLASSYGWPLRDILLLPRADRRALVATIDEERARSIQIARGAWR